MGWLIRLFNGDEPANRREFWIVFLSCSVIETLLFFIVKYYIDINLKCFNFCLFCIIPLMAVFFILKILVTFRRFWDIGFSKNKVFTLFACYLPINLLLFIYFFSFFVTGNDCDISKINDKTLLAIYLFYDLLFFVSYVILGCIKSKPGILVKENKYKFKINRAKFLIFSVALYIVEFFGYYCMWHYESGDLIFCIYMGFVFVLNFLLVILRLHDINMSGFWSILVILSVLLVIPNISWPCVATFYLLPASLITCILYVGLVVFLFFAKSVK